LRRAGVFAIGAKACSSDKKAIITFNQLQLRPLVCMGKFTASFLSGLAKKLVDMSGGPSERQWLHHRLFLAVVRKMLPAYCPVCKFDLIVSFFS